MHPANTWGIVQWNVVDQKPLSELVYASTFGYLAMLCEHASSEPIDELTMHYWLAIYLESHHPTAYDDLSWMYWFECRTPVN